MRRSFGGSGGGTGGTGGGGGGMLRTVQRAVRTGVGGATQDPFSHSANSSSSSSATTTTTSRPTYNSKTSTALSLSSSATSSSPFSSFDFPISASSALSIWLASSSPTSIDGIEWEYVGGNEDEKVCSSDDDFVFGSVPSTDEVQSAVSALHRVLDPTSFSQLIKGRTAYSSDTEDSDEIASPLLLNRVPSAGKELDWIEPSLQLCNPRVLQRHGFDRVYDAFHLLRTDPSIQRMVMSLSSDKAVWDAVMNNEVVRELRESLTKADNGVPENSNHSADGSNAATDILRWIFNNTMAKLMELMEKITKLANELFQPSEDKNTKAAAATDMFQEKLRTSFMLSVVVLLIVVVSRARMA
ncbi:hypothetical protein U1Q18_002861 [Sarracenia purpurea var. burkii]